MGRRCLTLKGRGAKPPKLMAIPVFTSPRSTPRECLCNPLAFAFIALHLRLAMVSLSLALSFGSSRLASPSLSTSPSKLSRAQFTVGDDDDLLRLTSFPGHALSDLLSKDKRDVGGLRKNKVLFFSTFTRAGTWKLKTERWRGEEPLCIVNSTMAILGRVSYRRIVEKVKILVNVEPDLAVLELKHMEFMFFKSIFRKE